MSLKGEEALILSESYTEEVLEGVQGFSPKITENADNTDKDYKLDIETADGTFTTPNLMASVVVDSSLNYYSQNPVQNSAVTNKFDRTVAGEVYLPVTSLQVFYVTVPLRYQEDTTENKHLIILSDSLGDLIFVSGLSKNRTIKAYRVGTVAEPNIKKLYYKNLDDYYKAELYIERTNGSNPITIYGATGASSYTQYGGVSGLVEIEIENVSSGCVIDELLDIESTNAIQNKAVAEALDGIMNTYISISDLNTRKGTSISLIANEDNTQQIIDALDVREQFVEWFGNSNDRFGINPKTYGDRINELRIIKTTETNAIITAIMNSGAVLSRLYTGGALGDWTSTGHILNDGYTDDGTISITGSSEDSTGMYGNGVLPETIGFSRDAMTWANGCYRISNMTDLVGLPDNLQLGRLEHFNLKRWKGNHNPHTKDWAERMSVFYSDNGNIYTRLQISGATAGVITTDTGWRCVTQNTKGLVTNAQNFKIDITKRNASWYGMFTFNFTYGYMPCEINFVITDKVYYTITKGQNVVSAITYTQNGANYIIGIDFTTKMYGTQVVDMPSEFGTINSLTAETFAGATTAVHKGSYSMYSYSSLADLGLTTSATIDDIISKMADNSMFVYKTDVFDISKYENLQYATVSIIRQSNSRVQAIMTDKDTGNLYVGKMDSTNKIVGWTKVATEEIIHTSLSGNLAGITTVLDLVNALLTEYRATSPKKPVRFVSGEISKTTLTDLPVAYGVLQITVAGWDVVEVRLAHSANGFKSMYYGFLNRISGQESISSITWEKVTTKADLNMMSYSKPSQLGLSDTSCTTVELAQALRNKANNDREINYIGIFDSFDYAVSDAPSRYGKLHIEARASDRLSIRYEGINGSSYDGSWIGKIKGSGGTFSGIEWERVDNTYSTTEISVGTWIDGSTIYRTVVEFNSVEAKTSESEVQVATNIPVATPQKVIRMEGFVNLIGNQFYIHYPNITCNDDTIKATVNIANGNVKLKGTWKYPIGKGALILEYTK